MIPEQSLPEPWIPTGELPRKDSQKLEEVLFAGEKQNGLKSKWFSISNQESGERAFLRVKRLPDLGESVSAFIFTPQNGDERVNNRSLRSISLASIEQALEEDRQRRRRKLDTHLFDHEWDPHSPLGSPREVKNFYTRVASQFLHLKKEGEPRPVAEMARLNERPIKTVQGWVTEARKQKLLPPGKPGKAG